LAAAFLEHSLTFGRRREWGVLGMTSEISVADDLHLTKNLAAGCCQSEAGFPQRRAHNPLAFVNEFTRRAFNRT
jgi:hypothetical protein